jgi:hypothetical protein
VNQGAQRAATASNGGQQRTDSGLRTMTINRPFTRDQRITVIYGMLAFVLMLVVLQLWLFTATMNAYLGGDTSVVWPAAGASLLCFLLNLGLLRYLYHLDRARQ